MRSNWLRSLVVDAVVLTLGLWFMVSLLAGEPNPQRWPSEYLELTQIVLLVYAFIRLFNKIVWDK